MILMPKLNQKGIAHLFLILIILAGLGLTVYLVQQRTNILPHASEPVLAYPFGKAIQLTRSAIPPQYISASGSAQLNPTANFTVEAWVKPELPTTQSVSAPIASKTKSSITDNAFNLTYTANLQSDGKVSYYYNFTVNGKRATDSSCISPSINSYNTSVIPASVSPEKASSWRHVAAVVKDGVMSLYEDGRLLGTRNDWVLQQFCTSTSPIVIGSGIYNDGTAIANFPGLIDEVRISNSARYSGNFTVVKTPFVSDTNTLILYHFDGDVSDNSASGRGGVVNGSISYVDSTIVSPIMPSSNPAGAGYFFSLSPQSDLAVGKEFGVSLRANTNGQSANTFLAKLKFDPAKLEVSNIVMTATPGSFITQVDDVYFDNSSGEISLIGGLPTPGFTSTGIDTPGDRMAQIIFKVKASGNTSLNISEDSQMISDNTNTNIFQSLEKLELNLGAIPSPSPIASPSVTVTSAPDPSPSIVPSVVPSVNPYPTQTVKLLPGSGRYTPNSGGTANIEVVSLSSDQITLTTKISGQLAALKPNTVYKVYLCRIDSYLSCGTNATPEIKTDSDGKVTYATNQFGMNDTTKTHRYFVKVVEEPAPGPLPADVCTNSKPCAEGTYSLFPISSPAISPSPSVTPVACNFTSAKWVTPQNPTIKGNTTVLQVEGSAGCIGKKVAFTIKEDDGILGSENVSITPSNATFSSDNRASTTWLAEFQQDGFNGINNPPEYFFIASLVENPQTTISSSTPELQVNNLRQGEFLNGDGNKDGKIDILDLSVLRKWWNKTGFPPEIDIDDNGVLNTFDLGGLRKILETAGIIKTKSTP